MESPIAANVNRPLCPTLKEFIFETRAGRTSECTLPFPITARPTKSTRTVCIYTLYLVNRNFPGKTLSPSSFPPFWERRRERGAALAIPRASFTQTGEVPHLFQPRADTCDPLGLR
jgi:hypothetical protein